MSGCSTRRRRLLHRLLGRHMGLFRCGLRPAGRSRRRVAWASAGRGGFLGQLLGRHMRLLRRGRLAACRGRRRVAWTSAGRRGLLRQLPGRRMGLFLRSPGRSHLLGSHLLGSHVRLFRCSRRFRCGGRRRSVWRRSRGSGWPLRRLSARGRGRMGCCGGRLLRSLLWSLLRPRLAIGAELFPLRLGHDDGRALRMRWRSRKMHRRERSRGE